MVKSKKFKKLSLKFSFGQGSSLILHFAWPNSIKAVLLQIPIRFEIFIFNIVYRNTWLGNWKLLIIDLIVNINLDYFKKTVHKLLNKILEKYLRVIFLVKLIILKKF